jgi:hypothetical protein
VVSAHQARYSRSEHDRDVVSSYNLVDAEAFLRTYARIDNNEYSGLVDDDEEYIGDNSFWGGGAWEERLGWGGGKTTVGRAGRLVQMLGMAKVSIV